MAGAPGVVASRRSADFVLYLDFDGVLHHEQVYWHPRRGIYMHPQKAPGRSLFEWVSVLQELLDPYPEVALVLSSSWCVKPGYGRALKFLPEDLRSRFIGGTFHKRVHRETPWHLEQFRAMPRGLQIWADVCRRKPREWLALDDDAFGWPAWAESRLVRCQGDRGLSDEATQAQLAELLRLQAERLRANG